VRIDVTDWRDLEGREADVHYAAAEVHPILPDNPGNFYYDNHRVPNDNQIRFSQRQGRTFHVDWRCRARAWAEDEGDPIEVSTRLPFRALEVCFEDQGSVDVTRARELVCRIARVTDLDKVGLDRPEVDHRWVRFPLKEDAG
jgi:hypothetical protein